MSADALLTLEFSTLPEVIRERARDAQHPEVLEAAVIGIASERWGETPVAFAVLRTGHLSTPAALLEWVNARLGKTQRLADIRFIDALPRSHIGKVLKRELRNQYQSESGS
jgi:long-chain acyl-CoA synthetase